MDNQIFRKSKLATAIIAVSVAAPATHAAVIEEIVVTATKRQESIQEVPVSVSALSGEQISELGLSDLQDITQQIPAFQVSAWSPQLTIFNLRGVSQNNFVDNLEAPIAVYQDESYIASLNAVSGQLFDLERVEVLRGPQGTLFGRNATGGLVHYISRGADEDEANGYVEAKAGSFDRRSVEGAFGGALSDKVRGRLAFRWEEADGYIEPDESIPPVSDRAIGGADGFALRGSLQADFTDTLEGEFIVKYAKDDDVPTGGYVFENCAFDASSFCPVDINGRAVTLPGVVSGDVHTHQNDTEGFLNRDTINVTAKFTKSFGDTTELVSISNYYNVDKEYLEDGDAFPAPIVVFAQDADIDQFSQELRLAGSTEKFDWQVGGYYLDYQFDGDAFTGGAPNIGLSFDLFGAGIISAPTVFDDNPFDGLAEREIDLSVQNYSIFGQIDYHLTDKTTLTGGLRWSDDRKEIDFVAFFTSEQQLTPIPYAATESNENFNAATILNQFTDDTIDYEDVAVRLSVQHQFSDEVLGFVSYNRGIKGGNWTVAAAVAPDSFEHDEEVLNAFEVGVKADLSPTVRVNATAYYYDYQDYQNFVAIPPDSISPNPQVGNSDVTAFGAEFELFWVPTDNLDILLGVALNDSEVDVVDAGDSPILNAELPNAPGFSGNYLIRYALPLSTSQLIFQFDGAYYGDQFLEVTNGPGTEQGSYNVSNASITWQNDNWSVTAWGKNVFDETYRVYSLDLGALGATTFYAPPITGGATVRFQF